MSILQALILGSIQGITEFLPVSSSGHLVFVPKLFGWTDQGLTFDTTVHLGTLLAVVWYMRGLLKELIVSFLPGDVTEQKIINRKFTTTVIIATIPAGLAGLFFGKYIENNLRAAWVVGLSMIVWGVVLFFADRKAKLENKENYTQLKKVSWGQSLLIGCAQAVAIIPGTSRSGMTITAGLFSGMSRAVAAEYSFLMSIPIIALAGGKQIYDLIKIGSIDSSILPLIIGFFASFVSGSLAIYVMMKIIKKWSYRPFVYYRIVLGILILLFLR